MNIFQNIRLICWGLMFTTLFGCIEPFNIETETFESALVIEATITNEDKLQEVKLSRTYAIDLEGPSPESNASVLVKDETGNTFEFSETEPGLYQSNQAFSAVSGMDYTLSIVTSNGLAYHSEPARFNSVSAITSLSAQAINNEGVLGVGIFIDSEDPSGNSRYYRYTYEETYKIVAPKYSPQSLKIIDDVNCVVELEPREDPNQQICFNSETSNTIILTSTNELTTDEVLNFILRFLPKDDPIIGSRYSILVNQFTQTREAYVFYETLQDFSDSGSIFSQIQPGFFGGNVFSVSNSAEKVIGFFDVSSVVSQRLYFNYTDFYDDESPYFIGCNTLFAPVEKTPGPEPRCPLIDNLRAGTGIYFTGNGDPDIGGPYFLVPVPCGNCTVYGANVEPDFWID